jgi:hypothetical protein
MGRAAEEAPPPAAVQGGAGPGDDFRFPLRGELGACYQIERDDDLRGWSSVGWLTNFCGTKQFSDAGASNQACRVYRAVLAP